MLVAGWVLAKWKGLSFVDGLDEVADESLRARVFAVFRDACRRWQWI